MSDTNTKSESLFALGNTFGTDKITQHRYDRYYEQYLKPYQNERINLFEIGIDNRNSLTLWLTYFPNAMIYGLDIDLELETDRAKVYRGDQSDRILLNKILDDTGRFDIIIDDGSHVPEHQIACFNYLFDKGLESGGLYIIEDIETGYWKKGHMYGYDFKYGMKHPFNIIEVFKPLLHHVNREFLLEHEIQSITNQSKIRIEALKHISSIMFARNCVILKKMDKDEIHDADRPYRFSRGIED